MNVAPNVCTPVVGKQSASYAPAIDGACTPIDATPNGGVTKTGQRTICCTS